MGIVASDLQSLTIRRDQSAVILIAQPNIQQCAVRGIKVKQRRVVHCQDLRYAVDAVRNKAEYQVTAIIAVDDLKRGTVLQGAVLAA
jgi:hypothetical protein